MSEGKETRCYFMSGVEDIPSPPEVRVPPELVALVPLSPGVVGNLSRPGYSAYEFAKDIWATMWQPPAKPRRLRSVLRDMRSIALSSSRPLSEQETLAKAVASTGKFLRRFRRSQLRSLCLDAARNDPVAATNLFLHLLYTRFIDNKVRAGYRGGEHALAISMALDSIAEDMNRLDGSLVQAALLAARKKEGEEGDGQSSGGGYGHELSNLVETVVNVSRILRFIRPIYKPYEKRSEEEREEVLWPGDVDVVPLKSWSARNIVHVITRHMALDEDEFLHRMSSRALMQRSYFESKEGPPKKIAMLIDSSSSMTDPLVSSFCTRQEFAIASAIALLDSCLKGSHKVILRFFDAKVTPPVEGTPEQVKAQLLTKAFIGSDTRIEDALMAVDVNDEPDEIILITDGQDENVGYAPKAKLSTYLCWRKDDRLKKEVADTLDFLTKVSRQLMFAEDIITEQIAGG